MHIGRNFSHSHTSRSGHGSHGGHSDGKFGFGGGFGPQQARGRGPEGAGGPPFAGGHSYTVRQGDSLWNLSNRMRSGGDTRGNWDIINEIVRDNGIKNPNLIFPGQTFNLRGPMGPDTFSPAANPNSPIAGAGGPGPRPAQGGDGVPYINQLNPAGKDAAYTNADQNCGPAVMAMIAKSRGLGGNLDDADLIMALGKTGQTDATGTSGNGLIAMADELGLKTEAAPGANSQWVMNQLAQGKDVIANGDFWALPQHADAGQTSPHYILLTGVDQNGNIMVKDPIDPNVKTITPGQLDAYTNANPEGGFNIAVG